ncbi:ABC transporter permease [Bifidobacterium oedipodis]|uniref:ABC transporter permease n=1 Tax=Bifidobacterium oedipodis TaxID=2675322 RepID=A0A7Y0EQW7_9BIFI|nr:ABC transporter permease [Bifidobacterium sp. DSM 109957]NMM94333.1 ABC transporter permease [Bifidobacterium sp. DSM 109957]
MITRLWKEQFRDGCLSIRWIAVLIVSITLLVVQQVTSFPDVWQLPNIGPTFLNYMLLFNYFGSGTHLYLFLLPFLAALTGGSIYANERHTNRLPLLRARIPRPLIIRSSLVSGFLLGGLGGFLPLALSLLVAVVREPHMEFVDGHFTNDGAAYPLITFDSWVYGFYERNQVVLLVAILLYVFALSGLLACLAICLSFWTRHRYVEIIVPLVLSYIVWMATSGTSLGGLSFIDFLEIRVANEACCALGAAVTLPALIIMIAACYLLEVRHEAW